MDQVIQCYFTEVDTRTSYSDVAYQLRMDKKHIWLQEFAIWILKKLGCFALVNQQVVTRKVLDTQDFVQQFWAQNEELFKTYHYRGSRVLVGHEEFAKMHGFALNHPLSFSAQYIWSESNPTPEEPYGVNRTACGLKVTVIPWMKGILVLSKDFTENE